MNSIQKIYRRVTDLAFRSYAKAGRSRYCICCGSYSRVFLRFGDYPFNRREDARCPHCNSMERQRLLVHYFERTKGKQNELLSILHFAAEPCLQSYFRSKNGLEYFTADLFSPAMLKEDITALTLSDNSFDLILCSHVLEHVPEDTKAMPEVYRVLKPGGLAIIQSLINRQTQETVEGPPPDAPVREVGNHCIRVYGRDFADKLRRVGFDVGEVDETCFLTPDELRLGGLGPKSNPQLMDQNTLFLCRKNL